MDKLRKPSLVLLALMSALATLPFHALRSDQGWLAQGNGTEAPSFAAPNTVAAGTTITIDGTPSMTGVNQIMGDRFEQQFPETEVVAQANGDEAALAALQNGEIDLAALGRSLSDEELAQGLTEVPVTREKVAIIVGRDNPFRGDLSFGDFARIFRGEITNWAEINGPNLPIRFVDRPGDSDVRRALADYDVFRQQAFETGTTAVTLEEDDTATVVRELGTDGISYAIASEVLEQEEVQVVTMHSTLPDDPRYPYSQPRNYVYAGEPSLAVSAFLGFATNPNGQGAVVEAQQIASDNVTVGATRLPGGVGLSPDGQFMVRGTDEGQLQWLDAEGNPTDTVIDDAHQGVVAAVAVSPDGQTVVSSGADGTLRRWDRTGNALGEPMTTRGGPILALAISPDSQTILTGHSDGTVERWSVSQGSPLGEPTQAHNSPVQALNVPAGGQNFITGSRDGTLGFWNADGSAAGSVPNAHLGGVSQVTSSPDGQVFTTAGNDGTLRQWDRATLQPRGEAIAAHDDTVSALAYSPDGDTIATAGRDRSLRLWGPDGSDRLNDPIELDTPASSLGFTPQGQLVVGTADNQVEFRDGQGQRIGGPAGDTAAPADQTTNGTDTDLGAFLDRLRNLPPNTWWLLALIPALLIVAGIIGSLLGLKSKEPEPVEAEDDLDDGTPGAGLGLNFAAMGSGSSGDALPPEAGLIPIADDGWDQADPNPLGQARLDLAEGRRLMTAGHHDQAIVYFTSAIEATSAERTKAEASSQPVGGITALEAQALAQRGHALAHLDQVNEAMDSYNASLGLDASVIDAWIGKGRLLNRLGRFEEAIFCFDTALEMDATSAAAWTGKGQALVAMGRHSEGQDSLDRAAALGGDRTTYGSAGRDLGHITPAPGSTDQDNDPDVPLELQQTVMGLPSEDGTVANAPRDGDGVPPELAAEVAQLPQEAEYARPGTPSPSWGMVATDSLEDELLSQVHLSPVVPPASAPQPGAAVEGASPQSPASPLGPPEVPFEPGDFVPPPPESSPGDPSGFAGLPPEVQAAMASIPADAPDPMERPRDAITPGPGGDPLTPAPLPTPPEVPANTDDFVPPPPETEPTPGVTDGITGSITDGANNNSSLTNLPPEVLAALASIPAGSPDSFDFTATATASAPTPEPAPPPERASWVRLSIDKEKANRFYAVWHIDNGDRAQIKAQGGETLAVRLYDVTGEATSAPLPEPVEEQRCGDDFAQDWYLPIPQWDRIYLAEVGYLTGDWQWQPVAKSPEIAAVTKQD
jgi:ABC-type phosphate transport system substrate-binding protein